MKIIILILFILIDGEAIFSQQTSINQFNIERQKISKTGLKVLAAYNVANIVYGSIASSRAGSGSDKYFHEMNAIWNGINLGIVGIGLLFTRKEGVDSYAIPSTKQSNTEKLFLFNAGLDLAYIAGGAYLKERSKSPSNNPGRQMGYGESIILQGGVLFLFDGIMYTIHHIHGKGLSKMAEKMHFSITAYGPGVVVKL